jgi:hypothetical protein
MAEVFASPDSFFYNVGMNLLINGVEISSNIDTAVKDYDEQNFFEFGENIGKALALVVMGPIDPNDEQVY